jgi:hypothetical protein
MILALLIFAQVITPTVTPGPVRFDLAFAWQCEGDGACTVIKAKSMLGEISESKYIELCCIEIKLKEAEKK